ncbi:hypothetical protein EI555_006357, partial [Monodon monoceros]
NQSCKAQCTRCHHPGELSVFHQQDYPRSAPLKQFFRMLVVTVNVPLMNMQAQSLLTKIFQYNKGRRTDHQFKPILEDGMGSPSTIQRPTGQSKDLGSITALQIPNSDCLIGKIRNVKPAPGLGGPSWIQEQTLVVVKLDGGSGSSLGRGSGTWRGWLPAGGDEGALSSGPMAAMVWEGPSVVHTSRAMIQHTNLAEAAPSPIWRDYGVYISRTTTPSSHSVEGAQREIQLRFQSSELGVPKLTFSASQHPASCHKITELEECLHILIFQMATHFGIQKENMTKRFENTEAEHRDTNRPETWSNITEKQRRRVQTNPDNHTGAQLVMEADEKDISPEAQGLCSGPGCFFPELPTRMKTEHQTPDPQASPPPHAMLLHHKRTLASLVVKVDGVDLNKALGTLAIGKMFKKCDFPAFLATGSGGNRD